MLRYVTLRCYVGLQVGNWEIEVEEAISRDAFRSGKCFLAQEASAAAAATGVKARQKLCESTPEAA